MVNSVLTTLPTFYMCILHIPSSIFYQIDKYCKHELWDAGDINRKGFLPSSLEESMQIKRSRWPRHHKSQSSEKCIVAQVPP